MSMQPTTICVPTHDVPLLETVRHLHLPCFGRGAPACAA